MVLLKVEMVGGRAGDLDTVQVGAVREWEVLLRLQVALF